MRYPAQTPARDSRFAARGAFVANTETTTSTGWVELPTYGPVVIQQAPPSGRVNVFWQNWSRNPSALLALQSVLVTYEDTNGVIFSPNDDYAIANINTNHMSGFAMVQIADMDPGRLVRYRCQYRAGGGTAEFLRRLIHVVPVIG